ncbi:MAG TPA: hypothetical protein VJ873_04070 [bacterium]|nr:hypothetical protein [bacterium]
MANRKVGELDLSWVNAGSTTAILDLTDKQGVPLSNGLYYLLFRVSNHQSIAKLLILR